MLPSVGEMMTQAGSAIAGLTVAYVMFQNYFPSELRRPIKRYSQKIIDFFNPYVRITFQEYEGDGFERSRAYASIERYLNKNSTKQAKRLKANMLRDTESIVLSMEDSEEVTDEFSGIKLWWASDRKIPTTQTISWYKEDERRYFTLTFHRRHRDALIKKYLKHIIDEGEAIAVKERRRNLFTNSKSEGSGRFEYRRKMWSHVAFEHPASFDTLAMDPVKKQEIIDDLLTFKQAKDYYAKIGKAWKRGYLLYGPPGTGKSTMIAAMANLLEYDVYDLELTAVKDNTELRKLLIDTSSKSVLVIEDIDCSLDLTGQRKKKKAEGDKKKDEDKGNPVDEMKKMMEQENKGSQVTLSGLLNFIDGLWSACGGERIIVFTTNYVEKLDPALIRRGRMDKHIELAYCGFEAFKFLAKNYLGIEGHDLFAKIEEMLRETKITPADVAENLMPKAAGEDEEICLMRLVKALEEAQEEEENKKKAEEEEKKKAQEEEEKKKKDEKMEKKQEDGEKGKENGNVETEYNKGNGEVIEAKVDNLDNGVKENGADTK